ncbi:MULTISPECIES: MmcQ/YjbR family DNA-binding protein [Paenibacillus]|uniref:MmcQ/YjbR family DNA-binding protein n=1 Tax=Paenibacillus alvei TaxID=44250 RepID=A0ABT4E549_PAEAL|nr:MULTISPECIES: MmcQ/YjbR family DNA-binding protein [Paenibacillus]EPY09719.1 hypothetical protein PAAL66ix_27063 [Paenibacillus alvei A6-6i-x]MCY9528859.1 MmcQ/YjbR family DNA-binding protein [Paenibacillus alvei]SDG27958.1 Predicted DNA-binding protein, MmcQ/YjbR family [Paenibacillus sp. cl6col]
MQDWNDYCFDKQGARLTYPFGDDVPVFRVGGKIFALFRETDGCPSVTLKCDPFRAESLREQFAEITPGYHMNKRHWNTVALNGSLSDQDIQMLIDHSYDLVFKSLTREEKAVIIANQLMGRV